MSHGTYYDELVLYKRLTVSIRYTKLETRDGVLVMSDPTSHSPLGVQTVLTLRRTHEGILTPVSA